MGARQSVQTPSSTTSATDNHESSNLHHNSRRNSNINVDQSQQLNGAIASGSRRISSRSSQIVDSQTMATSSSHTADSSDSDDQDFQRILQVPSLRFNIPRLRHGHSLMSSHASAGAHHRTSNHRTSLPVFSFFDIKCPVCNKIVPSDEAEVHLVVCLTRPRITYNGMMMDNLKITSTLDDVLTEDKGECVICFDEMLVGETIARLPCLCIYHKSCIDKWFGKKNCCPEHPGDD